MLLIPSINVISHKQSLDHIWQNPIHPQGPFQYRSGNLLFEMASQQHHPRDPNTLSNYDDFKTTHTVANFNIDFSKEQLAGNVILTLEAAAGVKTGEITLDTSYLDVLTVKVGGSPTKWELLPRTEPYGSALKVQTGTAKPGAIVTLDVCWCPPGTNRTC